jgi:MOSC domain-containing protein YiiM
MAASDPSDKLVSERRASDLLGIVHQISISKGGVPKLAVPEAWASPLGLEGDGHNQPQFHGGLSKALLLVSLEDLEALRADGFPVFPGALGENLTIRGIDFRKLRSGQRFVVGDAAIELTTLRQPCSVLNVYNPSAETMIQKRLYDARAKAGDPSSPVWAMGGFYASIVQRGLINTGVTIALADHVV